MNKEVKKQSHKHIAISLDLKTARKLKKIDPTKSYNELIRELVYGK